MIVCSCTVGSQHEVEIARSSLSFSHQPSKASQTSKHYRQYIHYVLMKQTCPGFGRQFGARKLPGDAGRSQSFEKSSARRGISSIRPLEHHFLKQPYRATELTSDGI